MSVFKADYAQKLIMAAVEARNRFEEVRKVNLREGKAGRQLQ